MNQPLKSTSTRLCSHRAERRLRAAKSQSGKVSLGLSHQNFHGCTISPKLCSRERLKMLNMWPPTIVGRLARSAKVTARMMPSGSQTTSSSIISEYVAEPRFTDSSCPRAYPPEPPRLPCSSTVSVEPSSFSAVAKWSEPVTLSVPCSITITVSR